MTTHARKVWCVKTYVSMKLSSCWSFSMHCGKEGGGSRGHDRNGPLTLTLVLALNKKSDFFRNWEEKSVKNMKTKVFKDPTERFFERKI